MEYETPKRTKNLTLRDIHVGDWVQVWNEKAEQYSPPLKITQICEDGTVYLMTEDSEYCSPWKENIKNIDAIPIDIDLLRGFGFEIDYEDIDETMLLKIKYNNQYIGRLFFLPSGIPIIILNRYNCCYMHEFVDYLFNNYPEIKLEWKGIN